MIRSLPRRSFCHQPALRACFGAGRVSAPSPLQSLMPEGRMPTRIAMPARKPAETVAFAGVKPGMTIAELGPGRGYYTRIWPRRLAPRARSMPFVTSAQAARPGVLDELNALAAANPNIKVVTVEFATMTLPEKADLFWTTENYHDFHNGPTADIAALDKAVFNNLKPGGIFYVEDHSAAAGAGLAATSKFHRMDEAVAKTELTAAGFKLDGEGNLLRNPADNKAGSNSESGHFASDRFMLRMKRP